LLQATIISIPETDSTNNYAIRLLADQKPIEGTVIVTDYQTNGRGTDSNFWESEKGKNLTFSIILYPTFSADKQFLLNKAISLGIFDYLKKTLPNYSISIKWPNDIYVGDKKICGILIQNSVSGFKFEHIVLGIGLNINQETFTSSAPNPISLKQLTKLNYPLHDSLLSVFHHIAYRYNQIDSNSVSKIEHDYCSALYKINEWNEFYLNGVHINARITGTNEYGQLILETTTGEPLSCDFKEIVYKL